MSERPRPIDRRQFAAQQLVEDHPPRWRHRNKQIVHEIACPPGSTHQGCLEYSRWGAMHWPESVEIRSAVNRLMHQPGFYEYTPVVDAADIVEWHVNFADPELFVAYGSSLFAQDEMQVAEHPALGSLKEALDALRLRAETVDRDQPTPILVMNAERRCRIATEPNAAEGRPHGLYGNAFGRTDEEAIQRATMRIDPPTLTNLIAMAAPEGGYGRYEIGDIEYVLRTAYTAFRAAVLESEPSCGPECRVLVHTGFWGCGAFGGNRVLMTTLQTIAAEMAGLERIVFHTGDSSGVVAIDEVKKLFEVELADETETATPDLIRRIAAIGLEWGVSDGN